MKTTPTTPARGQTRTHTRRESLLDGPKREVVYIFEREGKRGGSFWWLVLSCGHTVTRTRYVPKSAAAMARELLKPLSEKFAPKHVQCHYCGSGSAPRDPWISIKAFGGPKHP